MQTIHFRGCLASSQYVGRWLLSSRIHLLMVCCVLHVRAGQIKVPNQGEFCWLVTNDVPEGTDIAAYRISITGVEGTTPSQTFYVRRAQPLNGGAMYPTQPSCQDNGGLSHDTVIIIACCSVLVGMFVLYKLFGYCSGRYTAAYLVMRDKAKQAEQLVRDQKQLAEMEVQSVVQHNWKRVAFGMSFISHLCLICC